MQVNHQFFMKLIIINITIYYQIYSTQVNYMFLFLFSLHILFTQSHNYYSPYITLEYFFNIYNQLVHHSHYIFIIKEISIIIYYLHYYSYQFIFNYINFLFNHLVNQAYNSHKISLHVSLLLIVFMLNLKPNYYYYYL